jgi:putative nucleotidyltransferase with HDIG domain
VAFILIFSWGLLLLFSRLRAESLFTLPLVGCLFLALPPIFSFHVALGGGVLGALLAFTYDPATLALQVILSGTAAGLGYALLRDMQNRMEIWRNLFLLGISLALGGLALRVGIGLPVSWQILGSSLVSAALWSSLVIAFLPLFENIFDVNSPLRLIELSHPSNPLLRRLQLEAPGTYHHVLIVGILAESAADRLGMNTLLVRAGAYYHDIGKLRRPRYFIENQVPGENVHDGLSPTLSALAIISHVRDGLRIAEARGIPRAIRRFIPEHHGTTVLGYFYKKALSRGIDVGIDQFTYPGPRPQSRETALVMLADSVEAAVKASGQSFSDPRELEELVSGVVESKILGHQLEDVDFTLKDLAEIKRAFAEVLQSMRHSRQVGRAGDPPKGGGEDGRGRAPLRG